MRSRSSRLFMVLLHLVGVSTNLPRRYGSHVGIVGVHPMAILLERLELEAFRDGLEGLVEQALEWGNKDVLLHPYWLQDDVDGKCYGPGGFSECGDATLWQLTKKSKPKRGGFLWGRLTRGDKHEGYTLQSVNAEEASTTTKGGECLVSQTRRKQVSLELGNCASKSSTWNVNKQGVLYQTKSAGGGMHMNTPVQTITTCLWRQSNATSNAAMLSPCQVEPESDQEAVMVNNQHRLVSFSLVKYQTTQSVSDNRPSVTTTAFRTVESSSVLVEQEEGDDKEDEQIPHGGGGNHMPSTKDMAHREASTTTTTTPAMFPELKPASQLLFPYCLGDEKCKNKKPKNPFGLVLKDSHPTLFQTDRPKNKDATAKTDVTTTATKDTTTGGASTMAMRPRRMPVQPYIAACKNGIWTDPQTGLEYYTDLSGYLGQDRKVTGRHTLMGVGQYTRTVFNIKVYGLALYVSKRDVLADPEFEPFATMTAQELRESPEFYSHLRHMPSPTNPSAGMFDRTLLLKLNMQISTDAMRASLAADWKMLNDEHKELLTSSSLNPRPALQGMLDKIASDENPSSCSCGQVAPPEYGADPTCCARGTELVFTWRKSGDLEIRLDGRIMDIFPRPDMAAGIFFDYLRYDDPISRDVLDRVPDGFPFMLAPLAQVKGVSSPAMSSKSDDDADMHRDNNIFRAMGNFADMVTSQTVGWVQSGAAGMASNVAGAARVAGDSMRNLTEEMDKRRVQLWTHVSSMPEQSMQFLSARVQDVADNVRTRRDRRKSLILVGTIPTTERRRHAKDAPPPRGRIFRSPMQQWFGTMDTSDVPLIPDEIGPIKEPTTNMTRTMFLSFVHLYLLLLLVVSMPGSNNTRTKLRIVRSRRKHCETEGSSRLSGARTKLSRIKRTTLDSAEGMNQSKTQTEMKKSLSYFL